MIHLHWPSSRAVTSGTPDAVTRLLLQDGPKPQPPADSHDTLTFSDDARELIDDGEELTNSKPLPFFERFLEGQKPDPSVNQKKPEFVTQAYPSDSDRDTGRPGHDRPGAITQAYPSDSDRDTGRPGHDRPGAITQAYPSDSDRDTGWLNPLRS